VGATQAVHTDLKEVFCQVGVLIQHVADQHVFGDFHGESPFILFFYF
jgi:hypothetical protein